MPHRSSVMALTGAGLLAVRHNIIYDQARGSELIEEGQPTGDVFRGSLG
jgi:hypothetical protein